MDYEPYDSSGTDDDLPPSHQSRIPRGGGRIAGNGRSAVRGSIPRTRMYGETDMEAQIHQLEQEAYSSVLRAFKAQADAITWEKESLITELRKELRLSNEEHRELLARVNADDAIRRIREWRKSRGHEPGMLGTGPAVHDPMPSPSVSASRKKQKIASSLPSHSFAGPSPTFHQPAAIAANQTSSSAAKRGRMMGPKGKKHKSGQVMPGASSVKMHNPSSGPSGRGQFGNRVSEAASSDPLIGRKVRTRWPDNNNYYEAVITDYNAAEVDMLLFMIGVLQMRCGNGSILQRSLYASFLEVHRFTHEISPEDIQWEGEDPGISRGGNCSGLGHYMNRPVGRDSAPAAGRGRGLPKAQSRKDFPSSQNGIAKKRYDDIQLLHTDTLIKEVERVFGATHPDPQEVQKAKKEHEQALLDAISRLGEISDGDSDERHFMHGQAMDQE
ncbi:protein EMSY-LIKE 3 isoform X2 [Nicotiana tabacum]|uniref:Protein EMSY-LIKE 3 isoform X2 n=1 Tax=Nicotiana tabacum TaxID=4097 RepID=A0AC58SPJ2_TOBAC